MENVHVIPTSQKISNYKKFTANSSPKMSLLMTSILTNNNIIRFGNSKEKIYFPSRT